MKIAPPPRPVPHSTRSPATRSVADVSRRASRWSSRARPIVGVGEVAGAGRAAVAVAGRARGCGGSGARPSLRLRAGSRSLRGLERAGRCSRQRSEVVEAELVLEVVLVEQRALEQVEVARRARSRAGARGRRRRCAGRASPRAGSPRPARAARRCPRRSRAGRAPRPARAGARAAPRRRRSRGRSRSGSTTSAQRPVVLGDEVVERGHHAVAGPALLDGVVHASG